MSLSSYWGLLCFNINCNHVVALFSITTTLVSICRRTPTVFVHSSWENFLALFAWTYDMFWALVAVHDAEQTDTKDGEPLCVLLWSTSNKWSRRMVVRRQVSIVCHRLTSCPPRLLHIGEAVSSTYIRHIHKALSSMTRSELLQWATAIWSEEESKERRRLPLCVSWSDKKAHESVTSWPSKHADGQWTVAEQCVQYRTHQLPLSKTMPTRHEQVSSLVQALSGGAISRVADGHLTPHRHYHCSIYIGSRPVHHCSLLKRSK